MKGISALIAIILLLFITITIAGFTYTFFMQLQEKSGETVREQSRQELQRTGTEFKIDNVYNNQIFIRNTGKASIDASKIALYINDEFVNAVPEQSTIDPGKIVKFTLASVTPQENDIVKASLSQTSASFLIRPDTRPPVMAFASPPTPSNGGSATNPVTIQVSVGDPSGVDACIVEWDGSANITMSKSGSGASFTCVNTTSPSLGTHNYKVYANDTKGQMAVSETRSVTITLTDNDLPELMFVDPTPPNAATVFSPSVIINASVTDAISSIASCTLEWNNGITAANESMTIVGSGSAVSCNVTKTGLTDGTYSYKVYASDSQNNRNVSETRTVTITILQAYLSAVLDTPVADSSNTSVQNTTFIVKANVTCLNNDCGIVQGIIRYNLTGTQPDTSIPEGSGTPFHTASNPQSCGAMTAEQQCQLTWIVNASGIIGRSWYIDANFTSDTNLKNDTLNAQINITSPPPPPVIAFSYAIQTTDQTWASSSWQTVATISSSNFVAGGKNLILATAQVGGSSINSRFGFRLAHGSTLTVFTDSDMTMEPASTGTAQRHQYGYMTVWTVGSSEDVVFQMSNLGGSTARADTIVIFAMRLDEDLVENQDWYFNENTALTEHTTFFQNFASITMNAGTGEDWLIIANPTYVVDSTGVSAEYQIDRDGNLAPLFRQEGKDTTEELTWLLSRVYGLAVGPHTFTVQGRDDTPTAANDHRSSRIFVLNLTKFKDYSSFWNEGENSTTTSFSTVGSVALTPQVQSDFLVMGFMTADVAGAGRDAYMQLQANSVTIPTGSDLQTTSRSMDTTDENPGGQIAIVNLPASLQTIDMNARGSTTFPVQHRSLFALSMTLAQP